MDIHRCRFVKYPPSAVNALALSHNSGTAGYGQPLRLAVGHANGDIDIWDPKRGSWVHEVTLRGGRDRSVEGLVWIQEPQERDHNGRITFGRLRLFSIGYSSTVTEWDLLSGLPLRQSTGNFGEVWCIAAQPVWKPSRGKHVDNSSADAKSPEEFRGQNIVVGCADGSLVLLSTANNDLVFERYLSRASKKNARALSLCFKDRNTVVAGFADSAIRVYDIRNGNLIRNMSLGPGPKDGPKEKLVWAVECLRNGTIVSGDSSGEVCFWDPSTLSVTQRIKGHDADVLCLTSDQDGKTVLSGGVDRKTVVYSLSTGRDQRTRWAKTTHRRFHKHDVKAMTRFENKSMSIVVSGGLDTNLIVLPLREFGKENHRTLPYTPQNPPVTAAGRNLISWWSNEITIWRVCGRNRSENVSVELEEEPKYKPVAKIALQGDENVCSASISLSGSLLAVATTAETKIFRLNAREDGTLKVRKLQIPPALTGLGCRIVQFSNDSKWLLCISASSEIRMARIHQSPDAPNDFTILPTLTPLRRLQPRKQTQNSLNGDWGSYFRTITRASFSSDSRIVAISDLGGNIDTFVLEGNEDMTAQAINVIRRRSSRHSTSGSSSDESSSSDSDSSDSDTRSRKIIIYGQQWTRNPTANMLPALSSHPIILSFRASSTLENQTAQSHRRVSHKNRPNGDVVHRFPLKSEERLLVLTATHELYEFDVLKGSLSDWSRRNPSNLLPKEFKLQRERAAGCVWDINSAKERVWMYGANWVCMFDLSCDFPSQPVEAAPINGIVVDSNEEVNNKRKRERTRESKGTASSLDQELKSKRRTTGAGSKIPDYELGGGVGSRKIRKVERDGTEKWIDISPVREEATSDDEFSSEAENDRDEEPSEGLQRFRRNSGSKATQDDKKGQKKANGTHEESEDDSVQEDEENEDKSKQLIRRSERTAPHFFLTNRYRPILAVVALKETASEHESEDRGMRAHRKVDLDVAAEEDADQPLEVVIVERPFWDLELPPRFVGGQEQRS